MTKRQLRNRVFGAIIALIAIFASALIMKLVLGSDQIYGVIKDFSTIFIAVIGAYLAYCFQRRQAFLSSLRELWKDMFEAKIEINTYIYRNDKNQENYWKAYRSLSRSMDTIRGVYKNVEETETKIGYYPFQPLHDIRKSLERIQNAPERSDVMDAERTYIAEAWDALRWSFLAEFIRVEPERPIIEKRASDPRRKQKISN